MSKELADELAKVWEPILGVHARERANNVACWLDSEINEHTPAALVDAIEVCNREDYLARPGAAVLTEPQILQCVGWAFVVLGRRLS